MTLWLQPGGAATLETVYVGKGRGPVTGGRWSIAGDEVTVQLDDGSKPLVYTMTTDRLVPKQWDHDVYGSQGLMLQRRAGYQSGAPNIFENPGMPGRVEP